MPRYLSAAVISAAIVAIVVAEMADVAMPNHMAVMAEAVADTCPTDRLQI
jgi:hypothetical protein